MSKINYSELVIEVADEVRAGSTAADAIREIAADYGADEAVLTGRFARAYPEGVPAAVNEAAKLDEAIEAACLRYNVPRSATLPVTLRDGTRVTAIGVTGRSVIAVRHDLLKAWKYPDAWFSNATMRFAVAARDAGK